MMKRKSAVAPRPPIPHVATEHLAAVAGRPPYRGGALESETAETDAVRRGDIGALEAEIYELAFDLYGLTLEEREAVRNDTKRR